MAGELLIANALIRIATDESGVNVSLKNVEKSVGRSLTSVERNFATGFKRGIDEAGSGVEMLGSRFGQMASLAASPIAGAVAGVAALGAGIIYTTREAMQLEAAMANVSTLWKSTPQEIQRMTEQMTRLDPALGNATELANGLYEALSAGIEPAQGIKFVADAAMLARAGLASTKEVVDVLTTTINAYGLSTSEAGRISDIMYKTVEQGKTIIPELAQTMGRVIPFAAALGISFEELGAATATLTKGGLGTDEVMTALRGAFANMIQEADKWKNEGIDILKVIGEQGMIGGIRALNAVAKGNIEMVRQLVPDQRALTAILALSGKQLDEYTKQMDIMKNASGATAIAFKKQRDSLSGDLDSLKNSFTSTAAAIGVYFLPAARDATKFATSLVQSMRKSPMQTSLNAVEDAIKEIEMDRLRASKELGVAGKRSEDVDKAQMKRQQDAMQLGAEQRKLMLESIETQWQAREKTLKQESDAREKSLTLDRQLLESRKVSEVELLQFDKAMTLEKLKNAEVLRNERTKVIDQELKMVPGMGPEETGKRKALEEERTRLAKEGLAQRSEAEKQYTVILEREYQARLQIEQTAFNARKSMGQVNVADEIRRLQGMADNERRSFADRIQAAAESLKVAKDYANQIFEHRKSMSAVSLAGEIKHYQDVAKAAQEGSVERMKAEEAVFAKENELRDKRRSLGLSILKDMTEELAGEGVTDINASDLERKFQERNRTLQKQVQEGVGKFTTGGTVDIEELQNSLMSAGKLDELARAFQQLGPSFLDIFKSGGTTGSVLQASQAVRDQLGIGGEGQSTTEKGILASAPEDHLGALKQSIEPIRTAWVEGLSSVEATATETIDRILSRIDTGASAVRDKILDKFRKEFPTMIEQEVNRGGL